MSQKKQKMTGEADPNVRKLTPEESAKKSEARTLVNQMIGVVIDILKEGAKEQEAQIRYFLTLYKNYFGLRANRAPFTIELPKEPLLSPAVWRFDEVIPSVEMAKSVTRAVSTFPSVQPVLEEMATRLGDSEAGPGVTIADSEFILHCSGNAL